MPPENMIEAVRAAIIAATSALPPAFLDIVDANSAVQIANMPLPAVVIEDSGYMGVDYSTGLGDRPQTVSHGFTVTVYAAETDATTSALRGYMKTVMRALPMTGVSMRGNALLHLQHRPGSNRIGNAGMPAPDGRTVYQGTLSYVAEYHPPY